MLTILACALATMTAPQLPWASAERGGSRIVIVAASWEEVDERLGEKPSSFVMVGSIGGGGFTKFYSNTGVTAWRDPATDLIVGTSNKKGDRVLPGKSKR
ncbi:hypothetical protein VT84_24500 [Gemmata sp. SH-PL17]|nr:hypothetical protein VT84_24500 [Gemmata sp. SH-PL17]